MKAICKVASLVFKMFNESYVKVKKVITFRDLMNFCTNLASIIG